VHSQYAFAFGRKTGWIALLIALMAISIRSAQAQALPSGRTGSVINFYESFDGSSSPSGALLRISNDVGYDFTQRLGVDLELPIYFVYPPVQPAGVSLPLIGLGNLAADGRATLHLPRVVYEPTVTIAFPTGSTAKGFSTGSVTYDLDNHFKHDFDFITPFLDIDVGNSLNNSNGPYHTMGQRPFMTLGDLAEFTAGAEFHPINRLTVSGDFYYVMPWGQQTVFSRIVMPGYVGTGGTNNRSFELAWKTVGGPGLVRDHGYDATVGYRLTRCLDLAAGFNRSMNYDLNTLSLSLGINVSKLLSRQSR
jgi:hypothetical protein